MCEPGRFAERHDEAKDIIGVHGHRWVKNGRESERAKCG